MLISSVIYSMMSVNGLLVSGAMLASLHRIHSRLWIHVLESVDHLQMYDPEK